MEIFSFVDDADIIIIDNMTIARTLVKLAKMHKQECKCSECDINIKEIREMVKSLAGYPHYEKLLDELGW